MEDAPADALEAVVQVVETPVNPLIAIDTFISTGIALLALVYILVVIVFNKQKKLQMGFCLAMSAGSFFRLVLGVQIGFPIFMGCMWLFNAAFIYISERQLARLQARNAEILNDIERMRAEINRIENHTYKSEDVWPPNPK